MFLEELNQKYERNYSFTKQAIFAITNYSWPGNVRELKNYVERAAILSYDDVIGVEQLPEKSKAAVLHKAHTIRPSNCMNFWKTQSARRSSIPCSSAKEIKHRPLRSSEFQDAVFTRNSVNIICC